MCWCVFITPSSILDWQSEMLATGRSMLSSSLFQNEELRRADRMGCTLIMDIINALHRQWGKVRNSHLQCYQFVAPTQTLYSAVLNEKVTFLSPTFPIYPLFFPWWQLILVVQTEVVVAVLWSIDFLLLLSAVLSRQELYHLDNRRHPM